MIRKNMTSLAIASLLLLAMGCNSGMGSRQMNEAEATIKGAKADTALFAVLETTKANYLLQDSVIIRFTVHNPTVDTIRFTQYHTPFEGMFSKFLIIEDKDGKEVNYIGAMTRRIMPPPEDTYHILAPGESESVDFSLEKGYKFEKSGTYKMQYVGEGVNGIKSGDAIEIHIVDSL